jgi:transposase
MAATCGGHPKGLSLTAVSTTAPSPQSDDTATLQTADLPAPVRRAPFRRAFSPPLTVQEAESRRDRLTQQIEELLPNWLMAPVVAALQAMRGVALVVAVTVVAEVGDFRRFANPRQLMAYLGLVPSEHSSGGSVRRGGITKAGNALARRVLIEGAWTYRMSARVSRKLLDRLEGLPAAVRGIAWKAQLRLCARYRRLAATGRPKVVVTTAIAREMVGFIWAIARLAQPALV